MKNILYSSMAYGTSITFGIALGLTFGSMGTIVGRLLLVLPILLFSTIGGFVLILTFQALKDGEK